MLEQKTAEFNRCLFQAEMGRGVDEEDTFSTPDFSPLLCQQVLPTRAASGEEPHPRETQIKKHSDVPTQCSAVEPEVTQSLSSLEIIKPNTDAPAQARRGSRGHTIMIEREIHDAPSKEIQASEWRHATKSIPRPESHTEVRLRKTPNKESTEVLCSESIMSENVCLTVDSVSSESDSEDKPQSRAEVSPSSSTEDKEETTIGQQVRTTRPGLRMNEHPWKQLTLAAYPRPEGSRSNFGAVERILKNYETATKNMNQQREISLSPSLSVREKSDRELDMLDMDSTPLFIRETLPRSPNTHKILGLKDIQLSGQDQDDYYWDT